MTGGTDKGLELDPLINTLTGKVQGAVPVKSLYLLTGTATDKLLPALNQTGTEYKGPFNSLEEMLSALKNEIDSSSEKDGIAVFSPGATSFGMFANEFDRGNKYMDGVRKLFS